MNKHTAATKPMPWIATVILGTLVLLAIVLFASRKIAAREAVTAWLRSQGLTSNIEIQELGLSRATLRGEIGQPADPDFATGDITLDYGFRGLNFEVRRLTLRRSALHVRVHNGRLSFGTLDPLLGRLQREPSRPDSRQPPIEIQAGVLALATDYGPIRIVIDGLLQDGHTVTLSARSDAARLDGSNFKAELGGATATLHGRGGRLALKLDAPFHLLETGDLSVVGGRLVLQGDAPYPDLAHNRADGPVSLHMGLTAAKVRRVSTAFYDVAAATNFEGHVAGSMEKFVVGGRVAADLSSASVAAGGAKIGLTRANFRAGDFRWIHEKTDALTASPHLTVNVHEGALGSLRLSAIRAVGDGVLAADRAGVRAGLTATYDALGSWAGLGPVTATDAKQLINFKRAAQTFRLRAKGVAFDLNPGNLRVTLSEPVQLSTLTGARASLWGHDSRPVIDRGGANFGFGLRGGGLPNLDVDVRSLAVRAGVLAAQGEVKASGSIGPVEGGSVDASGTLRIANGTTDFTAESCANVAADRIQLSSNDVERMKVRLCPQGGPLLSVSNGTLRLQANVLGLRADVPFLQARIVDGSGSASASQSGGQVTVKTLLQHAQIIDLARGVRFRPLRIAGDAGLAASRWSANFKLTTPTAHPVADVALSHDTRSSRGGITVHTGELIFTENGLQPNELSPLAAAVGSPVEGQARFDGQLDWSPAGVTSGGTLRVPSLDFNTPLGRLRGLNGTLIFNNLAPLVGAPGQTFVADSIAAIVPITAVSALIGLDSTALTLTGGDAALGGGHVRIERLVVPTSAEAPVTGVLLFDRVQLHDLVKASPFGDRVNLDAKVSGRVPFESQAGKLRLAGAELHAVQPGRLSINREALTAVETSGSSTATAGASAPTKNDTFTDFAYQAMENLAFDRLDAAIDSRADGRLAILAHIAGRHDPPTHQEINLSLLDLIGRKFMSKPLPLPSGTGVDLTLDTTLNLDELLQDYSDYQHLRGSPRVHAPGLTTGENVLETPR